MKNCTTCLNRIYDPRWGENKCKRLCHTIRDVENYDGCEFYNENPDPQPTLTKRWVIK